MVYLCLMDRCKAQKSLVFVGGFRIQKKKPVPTGQAFGFQMVIHPGLEPGTP